MFDIDFPRLRVDWNDVDFNPHVRRTLIKGSMPGRRDNPVRNVLVR